ncbi:MAG TPA: iron donor protein CyaY [Pseudomonadales bacterium]|nr:iron donor protein CyaY [Pseudomonadales bacterium]
MDAVDFSQRIDDLMHAIEDYVDTMSVDIDCEMGPGVLTMVCPNGSHIIASRQTATQELWLATKRDGYHFGFDEAAQAWISSKDGRDFRDVLAEASLEQAGEAIVI